MEAEKRTFIRHPLSYPLKVKVLHGPAEKELDAHSENIGAGGLLIHSDKPVQAGSEVEIELGVEKRNFRLGGKVVRSESGGNGSCFIAVAFHTPSELLKVRMMEQVVRIELFKKRVERRYKVKLDFGPVAQEWIKRYSRAFAENYSGKPEQNDQLFNS